MLSQLNLRFPKKMIGSLKTRAAAENTSVNALAERFLGSALNAPGPDEAFLRLTADPDAALARLYRQVVRGETFGYQALSRAELRFVMETAQRGYSCSVRGSCFVRVSVLETLLAITFELTAWLAENGLPVDARYIKGVFASDSENWKEEAARFLAALPAAVQPARAELLMRPLAAECFDLNLFPDDVLAQIFSPERLRLIYPLLLRTRDWSFETRQVFISSMKPRVTAVTQGFTAGSLRLDIRVSGEDPAFPAADAWFEPPRLFMVISGRDFVMPSGWEPFAELYRVLKVYRAVPEAFRHGNEGDHISLSRPGAVNGQTLLGIGALRLYVPDGELAALAVQLTDAVDSGPLAEATAQLRALYGDV